MNWYRDAHGMLKVCVLALAFVAFSACQTVEPGPAIDEQEASPSWFASPERDALVQQIRYQELLSGQTLSVRARDYVGARRNLDALRARLHELDDQAAGGKASPPNYLAFSSRDALLANIKRTEMMVHQTLVPGCDAHRRAEKRLEHLREVLCEMDSQATSSR